MAIQDAICSVSLHNGLFISLAGSLCKVKVQAVSQAMEGATPNRRDVDGTSAIELKYSGNEPKACIHFIIYQDTQGRQAHYRIRFVVGLRLQRI